MNDVASPTRQQTLAMITRLYGADVADAARLLDIQAYTTDYQSLDVVLLDGTKAKLRLVFVGEDKPPYYFERKGQFHPKLYVRWLSARKNPPFTTIFVEDIDEGGRQAIREKSWNNLAIVDRDWIIDTGRRYVAH